MAGSTGIHAVAIPAATLATWNIVYLLISSLPFVWDIYSCFETYMSTDAERSRALAHWPFNRWYRWSTAFSSLPSLFLSVFVSVCLYLDLGVCLSLSLCLSLCLSVSCTHAPLFFFPLKKSLPAWKAPGWWLYGYLSWHVGSVVRRVVSFIGPVARDIRIERTHKEYEPKWSCEHCLGITRLHLSHHKR